MIDSIFREVLPNYGYAVREEQIILSKKIYRGLTGKLVTIAEAEVGTGKTMAYLVAAVVARHHNELLHSGLMHPITITTSSIELQKSIVEREIPALSRMLLDYRIIRRPLNVVLRKGKEHYFCLKRFYDYLDKIKQYPDKYQKTIDCFEHTDFSDKAFDLDRFRIAPSLKGKICVKGSCKNCPHADICKYRGYIVYAQKNPDIDIQVTNHNLYLASAKMFDEEEGRLLRYSDFVIVDEAHKLKEAAEAVFSETLSKQDILKYLAVVQHLCRNTEDLPEYKEQIRIAFELALEFDRSLETYVNRDDEDEDENTKITLGNSDLLRLKKLADTIGFLEGHHGKIPSGQPDIGKRLRRTLLSFVRQNNKNVWVGRDETRELTLFGTEKNIGEILYRTLWDKDTSHVLTSGTMSDGTSFDFFCRENGIDGISRHLIQISKTDSPFDYENHTRLYIPTDMPDPNKDDPDYIQAIADKVVELVNATHGHTAILFTSYKVLNAVYEMTKDKLSAFDVICMTRSNKSAISEFKKSNNGVLFASGSMWEGVDCIGDTLSSVIIVRLPFPRRSAELEQKKAPEESMPEFIRRYALPEMLIKLRQGVGRLIRSESDTGVVSILDSRANTTYVRDVQRVMSKYPKVSTVSELEAFLKAVKPNKYWE